MMGVDSDRGTGRSTALMRMAPRRALFIVRDRHLVHYTTHLARALGREDLQIQGAEFIETDRWRGTEYTGIVIDHDVRLTENQEYRLQALLIRVWLPKCVEIYKCTRKGCRVAYSTDADAPTCSKGPRPMKLVAVGSEDFGSETQYL